MADLVDYLRDKLEHADDPVCTCGRVFVGWSDPPETVPGRRDPNCQIHGGTFADLAAHARRSFETTHFQSLEISFLAPNAWRCTNCQATGEGAESALEHLDGQDRDAFSKLWCPGQEYRITTVPERKLSWWRR